MVADRGPGWRHGARNTFTAAPFLMNTRYPFCSVFPKSIHTTTAGGSDDSPWLSQGSPVVQKFKALPFSLFLLTAAIAQGQDSLKPGTRVDVDIIMAGAPDRAMWKTGTISRIENGEYVIRLDNDEERSLPIRPDKHWVRASQAPPPAAQPMPSAPRPPASAYPDSAPAAPVPTPAKDGGDAELKPPGLGAPPNGVYNCQKIGQTYMGLGPLEIRGNTYRGIGDEGDFHPFTVDASGQITWSAGISGLPDGWTIRSSFYAGKDEKGHPLIKIYYRSKSGFSDLIDCVME